jgi:HSP20 family protein
MTKQPMDIQKQEDVPADTMERTHSRRCFVPKADIYETDEEVTVLADVPGASEKSLDITLERGELSIKAFIDPIPSAGYQLAYAEYEEGDYERRFRLSDEIDRDGIQASIGNGVLHLRLPKAPNTKTRKISVTPK